MPPPHSQPSHQIRRNNQRHSQGTVINDNADSMLRVRTVNYTPGYTMGERMSGTDYRRVAACYYKAFTRLLVIIPYVRLVSRLPELADVKSIFAGSIIKGLCCRSRTLLRSSPIPVTKESVVFE